MTKSKENKLTATQRIKALEETLAHQNQSMQLLAQEIDNLRQTCTALARRVNATIQAGEEGGINNEAVRKLLVDQNVQELKGKVDYLTEQGVLVESESETVGDRSFVVGRELDEDKNVVNPRMQFALASLTEEAKEKVKGKKIGDLVDSFSGDGISLEITELLEIAEEKKQDKNFEEEEKSE